MKVNSIKVQGSNSRAEARVVGRYQNLKTLEENCVVWFKRKESRQMTWYFILLGFVNPVQIN